jgi:FKBP12-rapamycin complex-associated protein
MLAFAPDYDHLPLIAKVEVFQHALQNTEGNDLAKVLCCLLSVCVTK